jgi:hypothetical protein
VRPAPLPVLGLAAVALLGLPLSQVLETPPADGSARAASVAASTATPSPTPTPSPSPSGPVTRWHFAPNNNFNLAGDYLPAVAGFNLADISSAQQLSLLPRGVKALVFLGLCNGTDTTFLSAVRPFAGSTKVLGFYLMDDPDPTTCTSHHLRAESDWIHQHMPGTRTFVVLMNMSAPWSPSYTPSYAPSSTHVDLFGLDMYPCRTEVSGCAYRYITRAVHAAVNAGVPIADIVPMYQAFGGGTWTDGGGGSFVLPTAAQEQQIIATWGALVPAPAFDYAYSWGRQRRDTALCTATELQAFFAKRN